MERKEIEIQEKRIKTIFNKREKEEDRERKREKEVGKMRRECQ